MNSKPLLDDGPRLYQSIRPIFFLDDREIHHVHKTIYRGTAAVFSGSGDATAGRDLRRTEVGQLAPMAGSGGEWRFPHRNAILGRESTPEEARFLAEEHSGY